MQRALERGIRETQVRIIEQFAEGKSGAPEDCEDIIAVTEDFAGVFDGAGDVDHRRVGGVPAGRLAALTAADTLQHLDADVDARAAIDTISHRLAKLLHDSTELLAPGVDRPRTCALILSARRLQIWRVGDSPFAVDHDANLPSKPVDEAAYGARAAFTQAMLAGGADPDQLRREDPAYHWLAPYWRAQPALVNVEEAFGYGALDGSRVPDRYLEVHPVAPTASQVALATDGYNQLGATLEETESMLQESQQRDPLGITPPYRSRSLRDGYHSFDDRAFLRIDISQLGTLDD